MCKAILYSLIAVLWPTFHRHGADRLSLSPRMRITRQLLNFLRMGRNLGRPSNPYHLCEGALELATDRNRLRYCGCRLPSRAELPGRPREAPDPISGASVKKIVCVP